MAADGYIEFSTKLDNSDLEKQLKEAERDIERLKKKLEQKESEKSAIAKDLEEAQKAARETEIFIERLKKRYEELTQAKAKGEIDNDTADARLGIVGAELKKQQELLEKQKETVSSISKKWEKNQNDLKAIGPELSEATARANALGKAYARSNSTFAAAFKAGIAQMNASFSAFMGRVTSKLKTAFTVGTILALLAKFKNYIMEGVAASDQYRAASANLQAVLMGISRPIIQAVIPAFTAMLTVITTVLITLARLVDSVFKTNFVGSIVAAQNSMISQANATQQATDATDANTAATNRNAKAKKEALRWLAAFDELNVMQKEDEGDYDEPLDSIGGGGLAPISAGDAPEPTWDGIDVGKITNTLAEIMFILGGFLLAVGAILAFSGINIPLGITLMVFGALLMYTAAQEQWGELPQKVKDAINGILLFTGIVLIIIGIIIAFAAPEFEAIGVGMIAAGALLIWPVVLLNWNNMPEQVQNTVTILMTILSLALLVIGAILTFTAVNPVLGVALMGLGAASLAMVVALNWAKMPEQMQKTIEDLGAIVGGALVVLGVILAVVSPVTAPLGIGMILIGGAALASSIALQWNSIPQKTREFISIMGIIIGAALVVLGVVLIITGVGLPLGLALVIAGIGTLAGSIAVNFNALQEKCQEVWDNITTWFNDNVAPVFTWEFWWNLFKNIVNGLIGACNSGLSAFGTFVNDIADGISSVLDFFGVSGYWFRISMPQIPYLAQGAVIPPNRQFMAVLGDQTNGRNLEAPESLIRQIVREESGAGSDQVVFILQEMLEALRARQTIECDGYTLANVVNQRNAVNRRIYGY